MIETIANFIGSNAIGFAAGLVGGWFAGGFYKARRVAGQTKKEIEAEAKARASALVKSYLGAILAERDSLRLKIDALAQQMKKD